MVARLYSRASRSCLNDDAGKLMAEYHRWKHISRAFISMINMYVGTTYAAGRDLYKNLSVTKRMRREFPSFELTIAKEE